jgi:hypothetical protein
MIRRLNKSKMAALAQNLLLALPDEFILGPELAFARKRFLAVSGKLAFPMVDYAFRQIRILLDLGDGQTARLDQAEGSLFEFTTVCLAFLTRYYPLKVDYTTLYFLCVHFFGGRSGVRHRPLYSQ